MVAHASTSVQPASEQQFDPYFGLALDRVITFKSSPDSFTKHPKWFDSRNVVLESSSVNVAKLLSPIALILLTGAFLCLPVKAQTDDFGDSAADPLKLFERGQSAHARGDTDKALELYEQALKLRPEFPEAEFQKGNALVSLGRIDEAEIAFRRAIQQKKNWALPYSALGALLMRRQKDQEAAVALRQALTIDPQDNVALGLLAEVQLKSGATKEALVLAQRATQNPDAPTGAWVTLAMAERANGNKEAARKTLDRILKDEPKNLAALLERSDLFLDEKAYELAITDLKDAVALRPDDKSLLSRLAFAYQQAGKSEEAATIAKSAGLEVRQDPSDNKIRVIGTPQEIEAANSEDRLAARKAIESLIEKNPRNAMLLARLGASYRLDDPTRSLELYRRAAVLEPTEVNYAVGYAAALVQARRFEEAAAILRKVIQQEPQNYAAHANLATSLYEAKRYADAISEFEWVLSTKPDVVVAHYFIATSYDYLGEYPLALASYQKFLASADARTNQLEIDKVKLRLPMLQRQIQLGEGVKKKP